MKAHVRTFSHATDSEIQEWINDELAKYQEDWIRIKRTHPNMMPRVSVGGDGAYTTVVLVFPA